MPHFDMRYSDEEEEEEGYDSDIEILGVRRVEDSEASEVSDDIREEIEKALDSKNSGQTGSFSFRKGYPEAPNPILEISEVGAVGLPLSKRDADAIKQHAMQAPFGKGERTVVDKTVRDTWEIDSARVTFGHPQWAEFLTTVVKEVCETLGVNLSASKPKVELHKLLLYETGSHFLPHVDTEKADGMFATVIIVLPSSFTGGAAHLSHCGLSVAYDTCERSRYETTVLAWYTDVTHEIKPIISGHRLALSYNLIHTTQSLRPAVSTNQPLLDRLTKIFKAWSGGVVAGESVPDKIVCLLEHKYSQANLHAGALKGADAQRVALINMAAKQHGFRLGLASAECRIAGTTGEYGYRGRGVSFDEVDDQDVEIEHVVDLEGKLLAAKMQVYEEDEVVPSDLYDVLERGACDREEHEPYTGNEAGTLERWYRRTVLIIWPEQKHLAVMYSGKEGFGRACKELESTKTKKPTAEETQLAGMLLHWKSDAEGSRAVQAICRAACIWKEAPLWCQAATKGSVLRGLGLMPNEMKFEAIKVLGFKNVKQSLEQMLHAERSIAAKLGFLQELEVWLGSRTPATVKKKLSKDVKPWITAHVREVLTNLDQLQSGDRDVLITAVKGRGGAKLLQDTVVPRLLEKADGPFLLNFATQLSRDEDFDGTEIHGMVRSLVASGIAKTSFYRRESFNHSEQLEQAKRYVQTCLVLKLDDLAADVVKRVLKKTRKLAPADAQRCVVHLMMPLISFSVQHITSEKDRGAVAGLREAAVQLWLDSFRENMGSFSAAQFQQMLDVVVLDGTPDILFTKVLPVLEGIPLSAAWIQAIVAALNGESVARLAFPTHYTGRTLPDVLHTFREKYARVAPLGDVSSVIAALTWCGADRPELTSRILGRILDPRKTQDPAHINKLLVPLVPHLTKWAKERNVLPSVADGLQKILVAWVDRVFRPPPTLDQNVLNNIRYLENWTCRSAQCTLCAMVKTYLLADPRASVHFAGIGATNKKHVEGYLNTYARGQATWSTVNERPQGLLVTKFDALQKYSVWKAEQACGLSMLKSISSDEVELQRILGDHRTKIVAALRAEPQAAPTPPRSAYFAPSGTLGVRPRTEDSVRDMVTGGPPTKKRRT